MSTKITQELTQAYRILHKTFGSQHWWPGDSPFEIIIGAILTQNTNWTNVKKAIVNLKKKKVLSVKAINALTERRLALLIKPAGYFNVKAKRIKNFMKFLHKEYQGNLSVMGQDALGLLREKLLKVNGIGPETADSILLYAFNKPIFVVDTYTKRIFYRHNCIDAKEDYSTVQSLFMDNQKHQVKVFNEFHALIVAVGKDFCKPTPCCFSCPLNQWRYCVKRKCCVCHRGLVKRERKNVRGNKVICSLCR